VLYSFYPIVYPIEYPFYLLNTLPNHSLQQCCAQLPLL